MHQAIFHLLTIIGGAALPTIAIPFMQTKFEEANIELESKLNEVNGRIDNPTQHDLGVVLDNNFTKSGSSWRSDMSVISSGISITSGTGVRCMSFKGNNSNGKGPPTYYLCREGV